MMQGLSLFLGIWESHEFFKNLDLDAYLQFLFQILGNPVTLYLEQTSQFCGPVVVSLLDTQFRLICYHFAPHIQFHPDFAVIHGFQDFTNRGILTERAFILDIVGIWICADVLVMLNEIAAFSAGHQVEETHCKRRILVQALGMEMVEITGAFFLPVYFDCVEILILTVWTHIEVNHVHQCEGIICTGCVDKDVSAFGKPVEVKFTELREGKFIPAGRHPGVQSPCIGQNEIPEPVEIILIPVFLEFRHDSAYVGIQFICPAAFLALDI